MRKKWREKLNWLTNKVATLIEALGKDREKVNKLEKQLQALSKPLIEGDRKKAANGEMPLYTEFTCIHCTGVMKAILSTLWKELYVCSTCKNKLDNGWLWHWNVRYGTWPSGTPGDGRWTKPKKVEKKSAKKKIGKKK